MAQFKAGENHLRVVARRGGVEVVDEIRFRYQTEKWGKPAKLLLSEAECDGGVVTLEAQSCRCAECSAWMRAT